MKSFGPSNFLPLLFAATLGVFAITRRSTDFILNRRSFYHMKLEAAIQVRFLSFSFFVFVCI
jgi:hypothetical protein